MAIIYFLQDLVDTLRPKCSGKVAKVSQHWFSLQGQVARKTVDKGPTMMHSALSRSCFAAIMCIGLSVEVTVSDLHDRVMYTDRHAEIAEAWRSSRRLWRDSLRGFSGLSILSTC